MAHIYRLVCCLLLTLLCSVTYAGVPKSTVYISDRLGTFSTLPELCAAWDSFGQTEFKPGNWDSYSWHTTDCSGGNMSGYRTGSFQGKPVGGNNSDNSYGMSYIVAVACPQNTQSSGNDCICKSGFAELGGQCIPDDGGGQCVVGAEKVDGKCQCKDGYKQELGGCYPDKDKACAGLADFCSGRQGWAAQFRAPGQSADFVCQAAENFNSGGGSTPAFPNCSKGCMLTTGTTVAVKDDAGKWHTTGSGKYVGSTCDPNVINKLNEGKEDEKEVTPPDSKDPGKCNGQSGTVNGVAVCLPYGEAEGDKTTKTETNSDGTRTRTDTKTTCTGSTCTTETKVTKIGPDGNSTGGSTTVTQVPKDDYCSRNPGSSVCKALDPKGPGGGSGNGSGSGSGNGSGDGDDDEDKSSFGGSCSGGWSCEGDAIQCAIAKEQHKRACELFQDTDSEAYKLYLKERDKEGSVLDGLKGNKDIDVSQYVNGGDDFIGGGSCPADRKISFSYGEVSIPYSLICPYISMFGVVIVVCAGIAGARIITRRDS